LNDEAKMHSFSVREAGKMLQLAPGTIRGLISSGFVKPARGPRREYRFSFQDMIVLRTARALIQARVSRRRIKSSLEDLKRHLPESMPLCGLSICAVGERVVVREGNSRWQADDGQYLLGLDVSLEQGVLRMVEHREAAAPSPSAPLAESAEWFDRALELEESDAAGAMQAYERAVTEDPEDVPAWTNWGRLLHEGGRLEEAESVYRRALDRNGSHSLLLFNLGVLLEDLGRIAPALEAYQTAVGEDPTLADCHYNLARLYEHLGKPQHAIRHLGQYRRLISAESH
jgi:tetratricopeptide (TPR) repeat protein